MATISRRAFPRLSPRSEASACAPACSTARPSWSTIAGSRVFDALRYRLRDHAAVLCAFDLLELDGADLRSQPLEQRKVTLAELLRDVADGIAFNRHFAGDGAMIFNQACALGCEGIVSNQLGSAYRSRHGACWSERHA
jgi:bifunctional non-homologous end joining protein LigD